MNFSKDLRKYYKGKRILVTGHTGFKGAWLTEILLNFGAKVCGYSLRPNTRPNLFQVLNFEDKITHQIGDIRNFKLLNKTIAEFKPDIIFHLAAQPIVRASYDDPVYTYDVNVMGTVNILESMRLNKIKAGVIITTDKVYKNTEKDVAYKEDDPLGGYDPYSNSKSCADLVVNSYILSFFNPNDYGKKHKTLIASARAGNVIGGGDWAADRLVPDIMRAFLQNNEPVIIRNPQAIRPWQHVFEPLAGYLLLGKRLASGDEEKIGAWNFGPEKSDMQSVDKVLRMMIAEFKKGEIILQPDKTKHEANLLKLDNSKAKKVLGWTPNYTLKEAIKTTADWYLTYYTNKTALKALTEEQINNYFA